jgi:uncharacterized protein
MTTTRDASKLVTQYRVDKTFYDKLWAAKQRFQLIDGFVIPPYTGRGFRVKKGYVFKVVEETGPQIADVALWNAQNTKECNSSSHTLELEGWALRKYSRLWSAPPWLRPMATIVEDTVISNQPDQIQYHYVLTHCNPEWREMRTGKAGLNSCHSNLLQAILPFGLNEMDIEDNFLVHQKTYWDAEAGNKYNMRGDEKPGDYVAFYAEMDLLVAVSPCPYGDGYSDGTQGENEARPLRIEIFDSGM